VIDWTVDYTANRKALRKTIGDFQNTQFKLAELKTEAWSAASSPTSASPPS